MKLHWRMARTAAPISNLVFDGLRSIGLERVTPDQLDNLRKTLALADRERLVRDLSLAPGWMHPLLWRIAGDAAPARNVD